MRQSRPSHRRLPLLLCLSLLVLLTVSGAFAATSALSGVLKDANNVRFVGVSVALYSGTSSTATATTTTNGDGRFYFTELAEGSWTVKPEKAGVTFSPHYRTYTLPPTVTDANFTGTPPIVTGSVISGLIKEANHVALSGVTVSLYSGTSTTPTATKTTDYEGRYTFSALAAGAWTVKPAHTGLVFSPVYRTYTMPATVTEAHFTGAPAPTDSTISGQIKTATGAVAAGVSVGLYQGDSLKQSATTNAEGRYSFTKVATGSWVVKPAQTGKVFDPVSRTIAAPPGSTAANFTIAAAPNSNAISGVIKTAAGAAVANVPVGLYQVGSLKASTTTNAEGRYYFTGLAALSYTVLPKQTGKVFDPTSRAYLLPPSVTNANFTIGAAPAGYTISGVIKTAAGVAVTNVSVGLLQGGASKGSTTTNAEGRYYFTGLAAGSYTVKPGQTGKVFDPVSRTLAVPPTTSVADFKIGAAPNTSAISGLVKDRTGGALMGVGVVLLQGTTPKATTTTNFEGRYTFTGLAAGSYVVRAEAEGMVFDPATRTVTVPPTVTDANFVGGPKPPTTLREPHLSPSTGTTVTLFAFSVIYTDALNRAPATRYLIIDGTRKYAMVRQNTADTNFVDGCKYIYKLLLPSGTHRFRFVFAAPEGPSLLLPGPTETATYSGPTVTGDTYVISGVIATEASHLQGVTVTVAADGMEPVVVATNADGRYYATGLRPGLYTVTPTKAGFTFDPPFKTVHVGVSVLSCGFRATAQ